MPRVIKAEQTRFSGGPARPGPEAALPDSSLPLPASTEADVRQAYEELINVAQEEVSLMLQDAREEATEIYRQAEQQVEQMRASVHEEVRREVLENAAQEVGEILNHAQADADRLLLEANEERRKALESMERQILKLALDVAEKILGIELEQNNAAFLSMLKEALGQIKAEREVTLRVNPSEYVRFFKSRDVTLHTGQGTIQATVINDSNVGFGGVLIETDSGTVDASAQAQLGQIAQQFGIER